MNFSEDYEEELESVLRNDYTKQMITCIKKEQFEFDKKFPKLGKQGIVGLVKFGDRECVFKLSKCIDFLVKLEYTILRGLNNLSSFIPHYCRVYGKGLQELSTSFKSQDNPFAITTKKKIENDVMFMEYIYPAHKLSRYVRSSHIDVDVIFSLIYQTLFGIYISQVYKRCAHYDIHSNNIMVKECPKDSYFLYSINDFSFIVPTFGYFPVIIDYGFGYINCEEEPLLSPLINTDIGFFSDRCDEIADPKLFLVTIADELYWCKRCSKSSYFYKLIKHIFKPLNIDWNSGWDKGKRKSVNTVICKLLENVKTPSKLFTNYLYHCSELLFSLIILPLTPSNYENTESLYVLLTTEFRKIEKEIGSTYFSLYIFKKIVEIVNELRNKYKLELEDGDGKNVIKEFRNKVVAEIDKICSYCKFKGVRWEHFFLSLIGFGECLKGISYEVIENRVNEKNKEYGKLKYKSIPDIITCLNKSKIVLPLENISEKSLIYFFDCGNKKCNIYKFSKKDIHHLKNFKNNLECAKECISIIKKRNE